MSPRTLGWPLLAVASVVLWWWQENDWPTDDRPEPAAREEVESVDPARLWGESAPGQPTEEAVKADPLGAEPEAATPAAVVVEPVKEKPQAVSPEGPADGVTKSQAEGLTGLGEGVSPEAPVDGVTEAVGPELPEGWAELARAAVAEPDAELRGEAIRSVSIYRGAEARAVLTEVAAGDPEPNNRIQALQSLWYAAADGRDQEGEIKRVLDDARADPDPDIAELAQKAMADLERLAARRANGG
jgi:hypothetical protein